MLEMGKNEARVVEMSSKARAGLVNLVLLVLVEFGKKYVRLQSVRAPCKISGSLVG